jgi:hypothetical protein
MNTSKIHFCSQKIRETLTSQNAVHSARTSFLRFFYLLDAITRIDELKENLPIARNLKLRVRAYVLNAATINHQPFGRQHGDMSLNVSTLELCPPALLR